MNYFDSNEIVLLLLLVFAIGIIPMIFFFLTQQNTLKAIQPQNRLMSPGEVWLQFIPLFNIVWQFIVVTRIADSIKREFESRNVESPLGLHDPSVIAELNKRPTYDIGITYCVLFLCGIIPVIGVLGTIGGFICWIIYWVKLSEYKTKIISLSY